jgi:hypothetical protein
MAFTKKFGLAGAGTSLVVAGALLVGGSAGAATQAKPAPVAPNVTGTGVSVAPGVNAYADVDCPAGTVVTGGGGQTSGSKVFITDSYRLTNGWRIRGTNTNTYNETLTAVAVCAGTS